MSGFFWTTYVLLWVLIVALTLLVVLLYRQFGLVYMRGGRRMDLQGLDIGETAPELTVETVEGAERQLTWDLTDSRVRAGSAAIFAMPSCPICKSIASEVGQLSLQWPSVELFWIDAARPEAEPDATMDGFMAGWQIALSADETAHKEFEIGALPFMYVIGPDRKVLAKKLVNNADDIDKTLKSVLDDPAHQLTGQGS
jgi:hypothetical protein